MAKQWKTVSGSFNAILPYTILDGKAKVEIYLQNETIWLTQMKIAELFSVHMPDITKHLKNVFDSGKLQEEVVCSILERATVHGTIAGKTREMNDSTIISMPKAYADLKYPEYVSDVH